MNFTTIPAIATICAAGLLASAAVQAAPTLITDPNHAALAAATMSTFDAAPLGSFTSATFDGVTWSVGENSLFIDDTYAGYYGTSGRSLINGFSNPSPIDLSFNGPVTAFGFNWGAADQAWLLDVYGESNDLLASLFIPGQEGEPYSGFIGASGNGMAIAWARLSSLSMYGYDYVLIDDVRVAGSRVGANAVPEPGSLALAGLALLGAAAARRRRKAA